MRVIACGCGACVQPSRAQSSKNGHDFMAVPTPREKP
jgi:hypothetical protein